MKIVSINYFTEVVDQEGLRIYKSTEEYTREVEAVEGDWAFAQLQDMLESRFTTVTPVAESTGDVVYSLSQALGVEQKGGQHMYAFKREASKSDLLGRIHYLLASIKSYL